MNILRMSIRAGKNELSRAASLLILNEIYFYAYKQQNHRSADQSWKIAMEHLFIVFSVYACVHFTCESVLNLRANA